MGTKYYTESIEGITLLTWFKLLFVKKQCTYTEYNGDVYVSTFKIIGNIHYVVNTVKRKLFTHNRRTNGNYQKN